MTRPQAKTGDQIITVKKIDTLQDLEKAKNIRYEVFVIGQNVPADEEIDQYEDESFHFIAYADDIPCGAARWRFTDIGIKLERFAVLEAYRGHGVGSALVSIVLDDIRKNPKSKGKPLYLHAQLDAMNLYGKFGFIKVGELFQECEIDHYKMVKE